jgi:hypothetical protein
MKVKELIEELKNFNPDAEVKVDLSGLQDENEFIVSVEQHHPNVAELMRE